MTSDLHLGIGHNDQIWLDQSVRLIEQIIDECHKRDIYTLTILGDLFHDRKNIYVKTLDTAIRIADLLKKNGIRTGILLGNHDVFYKTENTLNSLAMFREYDNIDIIDEPKIVDDVGFVPWNCDINLPVKTLLGHFEINSFPVTNSRMFDKAHYNPSDFSQYEKVISGHFHIPSTKGNITYLGAPYHMTFNDVGSLRGFYVFDNGDLEFIEFNGIKFYYISSEEIPDPKKIEGNVVRLIFEKDYGTVENNKKIEKIQSYNPLRFYTDFTKLSKTIIMDEGKVEEIAQTLKNNKEILQDFIDIGTHPPHINVKKMKMIVDTLMEEI